MEYSFSIYQRMRIAGLLGETELAYPISGRTTNAWGAREAWVRTNMGNHQRIVSELSRIRFSYDVPSRSSKTCKRYNYSVFRRHPEGNGR